MSGSNSHHRDDIAYASIDGTAYEAEVEEIGLWNTKLMGKNMECLLRQRFCRLTVRHDREEHKGHAPHEMGCGTMR